MLQTVCLNEGLLIYAWLRHAKNINNLDECDRLN